MLSTARAARLEYLDGLRAVAVLSVVGYHAAELSRHQLTGFAGLLARQGCHGVELFFVISGFCLSYPYLARLQARGAATFDVAAFAAKRLVRIVPPYYAALFGLWILVLVLQRTGLALPISIDHGSAAAQQVLRQAVFFDNGTRMVNTSFWTLAIELRWYLFFPIALWLWTRSPRAFLTVAVLAFISFATRAGTIDLLVLPAFMLGIAAAQVRVKADRLAPYALAVFVPVFAVVLLQTPAGWGFISPFSEGAAFLLVVGGGAVGLFERVLSCKALVAVGAASYSIYLVHSPIMGVLENAGIAPPIAALVGVAAGFAFWWLVERHFAASPLRNRLVARLAFLKDAMRALDRNLAQGFSLRVKREAS
jgi:peptidoglycan/LPS O-acetylase OafA/YrhL